MNASTPAAVSTRIRVFVGCFLGIVVLFGAVGFEAWPLTAFRLFSVARDDTRTSWEARTVDADGRETAFDQQDLPLGYRLAEWPLTEFPSSSDATRAEVCRGIAAVLATPDARSSACACTGSASTSAARTASG